MRVLPTLWPQTADNPLREGTTVAKKARKRRTRRKSKANHGKRPNAGRK